MLSYRWFQTSQTGGQRYSDTSPFSIPWWRHSDAVKVSIWSNEILFGVMKPGQSFSAKDQGSIP